MPSVIVVVGYAISFYLLTLVLRSLPVGITYAIWAGMGIFLIAVIGGLLQGSAGSPRGRRHDTDHRRRRRLAGILEDSRGVIGR